MPTPVITICYTLCPLTLLTIRFRLACENKRRDAEPKVDENDDAYIEEILDDGTKIERKVDKVGVAAHSHAGVLITHNLYQAFLDLTDIQNRDFRYVL